MIKVFTDGGSRGNPGPAASAFVVYKDDTLFYQNGKFIGVTTNNVAEYTALLMAVEWLKEKKLTEDIIFFLDSELIVKQLGKIYKMKSKNLEIFYKKITIMLQENFRNFTFKHVPRVHNEKADNIVNIVLNENK